MKRNLCVTQFVPQSRGVQGRRWCIRRKAWPIHVTTNQKRTPLSQVALVAEAVAVLVAAAALAVLVILFPVQLRKKKLAFCMVTLKKWLQKKRKKKKANLQGTDAVGTTCLIYKPS